MRVLLLVRPWTKQGMRILSDAFRAQGHKVLTASEFRARAQLWLSRKMYERYDDPYLSSDWMMREAGLDSLMMNDIIERCRYLRYLPWEDARRIVAASWLAADELYEQYKPDVIVGTLLDYYGYDVLERAGRRRGVPFLGLVGTNLQDYSRVTTRGELLTCREVDEKEVEEAAAELMNKSMAPPYMRYLQRRHLPYELYKRTMRELLRWGYLKVAKRFERDPLSFHFNTFRAQDPGIHRGLWLANAERYFERNWREGLTSGRPVAYVPLQFYPETIYDYWSVDPSLRFAPGTTLAVVEALARRYAVIVKEHPSFRGMRSLDFYRRLKSIESVVLLQSDIPTAHVLEVASVVIGYQSTTGMEAAIAGVKTLTYEEAYYHAENVTSHLDMRPPFEGLCKRIEAAPTSPGGEEAARALVRRILPGCLPGYCYLWLLHKGKSNRRQWQRFADQVAAHLSRLREAAVNAQRLRQAREEEAWSKVISG